MIDLIARGLGNQRIAEALGLGTTTVRNLVSHDFAKLGDARRGGAVIAARAAGMGNADAGTVAGVRNVGRLK